MSDDDAPKQQEGPAGAPAWMATFADLMSLLLTFFILILSFSDINQKKFKQVTATLRMAFGAQRIDPFNQIPIANSLTMEDFSSARDSLIKLDHPKIQFDMETPIVEEIVEAHKKEQEKEKSKQYEENMKNAKRMLGEDIKNGSVEVVGQGKNVIIRINEVASFPSGSDRIEKKFIPTLKRVASVLEKAEGDIDIAGHTDNIPISTHRFRNNWDLSAARASTMGTALLSHSKIPPKKLVIKGHADTRPIVPNNNSSNRAKNRRVEITIVPSTTYEKNRNTASSQLMQNTNSVLNQEETQAPPPQEDPNLRQPSSIEPGENETPQDSSGFDALRAIDSTKD